MKLSKGGVLELKFVHLIKLQDYFKHVKVKRYIPASDHQCQIKKGVEYSLP